MRFDLLVALMEPDHWVAYVRNWPGCFGTSATEAGALADARPQIRRYFAWLRQHGADAPRPETIETAAAERYVPPDEQMRGTSLGEVYIVNALFADDERPLTAAEISRAVDLLAWQRRNLLELLPTDVSAEIAGILRHIGGAEWWYWDRLDRALPQEELPDAWRERLEVTRRWTLARLPSLAGVAEIFEASGERWTARKLLRRAAWHERDHTRHIARLSDSAA